MDIRSVFLGECSVVLKVGGEHIIILTAGMQIFHNGVPMELLFCWGGLLWHVKPLFVTGEEWDEEFLPHDLVKKLHTQRAL